MCIIYKTTNNVNGKIYVGQHHKSDDTYLGSGSVLKKAIIKYGRKNFSREIIEYCSKENVNDREIFWISKLKANERNIGYNIGPGGVGGQWSEEIKLKYSQKYKGEGNPFYGKKHTEKTKKILAEGRIGVPAWNRGKKAETDLRVKINVERATKTKIAKHLFSKEKHPMWGKRGEKSPIYGIKKTEEHKKKISLSKMGDKNPNHKKCFIKAPDGKKYVMCVNEWSRLYSKIYNVKKCFLRGLATNSVKKTKGWLCRYI